MKYSFKKARILPSEVFNDVFYLNPTGEDSWIVALDKGKINIWDEWTRRKDGSRKFNDLVRVVK